MKEFNIKSIYDEDECNTHVVVLDKSDELKLPIVDIVNVHIINSSILNDEDFLIDDDIFSVKSKDIFEYLDESKTYLFLESNNEVCITEYCESRVIDLLYLLSGESYEYYFTDHRSFSVKSNNYFY